jgi:hypothetical protein
MIKRGRASLAMSQPVVCVCVCETRRVYLKVDELRQESNYSVA